MSSDLIDIVIPSIAFFVAFFVAFSLVEGILILILNRLLFHYWGFTVNVLIRFKIKHGKTVVRFMIFTIVFLVAVLLYFTSFLDILFSTTLAVRVFALELFLAMILIYLTTTRKLAKLNVEKQIHKYLYVYLSVLLFVFMTIAADRAYPRYKDFINANVVSAIEGIERRLEDDQKNKLLDEFRRAVSENRCSEVDFATQAADAGSGVKHFVYVATDPSLKRAKDELNEDEADPFVGRSCTNGKETFLLTEYGKWYWIIDE